MSIPARDATPSPDTFREIFSLLNQHDANLLMPYWDPDIVEEFPTGTVRGREAVRDYFAATFAALPDFHIEVKSLAQGGDQTFVRWHMEATFSGAMWMGIEPNGARIALDGIDCFTVKNGLVVHNFVAYDQVSFGRQIGLLPPEGSVMDRMLLGAFNTKTRLTRRFRR